MHIDSNNIALLGLGKENLAFLTWLIENRYQANVTICDRRNKKQLIKVLESQPSLKKYIPKLYWRLEEKFNYNLKDFDLLFRSPGWPLDCPGIKQAKAHGTLLSSAMEYFLAICPSKNIIGVTGSKGKGTTASLITAILKADKRKVFLGGNIGIAPFSFINKIKKDDWIILELSSFQLEELKISPRYAIITNIFKEHLLPADPLNPNYHKSLGSYFKAKLNIANNPENKILIANEKIKTNLKGITLNTKIIYFKSSALPSKLEGSYNQENIAAAVTLCQRLKINKKVYQSVIKNFSNLEHRLELIMKKNGIKYYDNSFSTTPESTALDLISFNSPIILLAGGADKGANFKALAKLIKQKVKYVILFTGQASPKIIVDLKIAKYPENKIKQVSSMAEAVKIAKNLAQTGDIVLLSTACASFGLFKNYKERGEQFKHYVKK